MLELAVVQKSGAGDLALSACNFEYDGDGSDWVSDADRHLHAEKLRKAKVSVVLGADAYSLQLIEAPNVAQDEMTDAVRWRIQNQIDFPVEEAAIETLEMPAHSNPGNKPMICAVVSRRDVIREQVEKMRNAKLHLDVIDIPELCMRNVAVKLPQDRNGVAFLHFTDDCGYLTITHQGVLYMIRRIEIRKRELSDSCESTANRERAADVALEVQRSLDYYESHYDCRPVTELVLGPGDDLDALSYSLGENLGISVSRLILEDLFVLDEEIPQNVQSDCLLAVGAALRGESAVQPGASRS